MPKFAIINRAPIMTAWSFIVAERLGFQREEALSIGAFLLPHSPSARPQGVGPSRARWFFLYGYVLLTPELTPLPFREASVYTEMNAISKGVSLGIYDESKKKGVEASKDGSQPYVDLMGRRYVLHTFLHPFIEIF